MRKIATLLASAALSGMFAAILATSENATPAQIAKTGAAGAMIGVANLLKTLPKNDVKEDKKSE